MKTSCLTRQLAFAALIIVIALVGGNGAEASGGGSWGGSWGGGSVGGSWGGSGGGFRTPVRNFFAYRQPVRNLLRGVASGIRPGYGSRGYASWGGYGSVGYGSGGYASFGGSSYGSVGSYASFSGGYASGGYSYYGNSYLSSAPSLGSSSMVGGISPMSGTIVSQPIMLDSSVSPATAPYSDSTFYGDSTILDSGSITSEPYYSQGPITTGGEDGGSIIDDTTVRGFETPPSPEPADGGDADGDSTMLRRDAILSVSVPRDAKVFVNNRLTKTGGNNRSYVSRRLKSNHDYPFEVRAEIQRNGQTISLDKRVVLRGGESRSVSFDFETPVLTQLTVKVPENAHVKLCGNETSATGTVRNYRTKMKPGKVWEDYEVEVSLLVDGQTVTRHRSVTIMAGGQHVVDFESENDLYVSK